MLLSESSLININKKLESKGKEQLYLIYPIDGVTINDSTFAFINNNSEKEAFDLLGNTVCVPVIKAISKRIGEKCRKGKVHEINSTRSI